MSELNKAVQGEEDSQCEAFQEFVSQFGTHYIEEAQLGARIHYERRFTKKSTSVGTTNTRKDCIGKAAEGCTGGNFAIFFISLSAETCPAKSTEHCTVSQSFPI